MSTTTEKSDLMAPSPTASFPANSANPSSQTNLEKDGTTEQSIKTNDTSNESKARDSPQDIGKKRSVSSEDSAEGAIRHADNERPSKLTKSDTDRDVSAGRIPANENSRFGGQDGGMSVEQPKSGHGVQHPTSLLMMFFNIPEVNQNLVRRVQHGFGDTFLVLQSDGIRAKPIRILSFDIDCISTRNVRTVMAMLQEEKVAREVLSSPEDIFSFEEVAGMEGGMTNVRVKVATKHECGRKTLRREISSFLLRSFRRNPDFARFVKQVEDAF